ncbi:MULTISPECIES: AAA family ATPase [Rhodococcus]|uniref:AAA family ATPase n=1 Tax=Rhodococcus qingshengii JCM 15477 TaxID=1303681 RepID=A0AB38RC05_RHOSG|nr:MULTISPECIES: AAA family ATPase [Rhodococcus]QXC42199.1 AAA family ATPase [Rhodococcus qingshengii]UPU42194.1 AAA family ATPase [Rhodococcus qingshengii JCM 15477]
MTFDLTPQPDDGELPPEVQAALDRLMSGELDRADEARKGLRARRASDMDAPRELEWIANGRVPKGCTTILIGDEGIGKSLFWVWLVAKVTKGEAVPLFGIPARSPMNVAIVATEDDWATVVAPRLIVAGVDMKRVYVISSYEDGAGSPTFPDNMNLIPEDVGMIVVDAWLDTVSESVSVKDPQQARTAIRPWTEFGTRTGITPLLLTHTNRVSSGSARDKYGSSGELRKIARMTLFAQVDDDGTFTVGPEKHNTTAPIKASVFRIEVVPYFPPTEENNGGTIGRLVLVGDSEHTAREQITASHETSAGGTKSQTCKKWLSDFMDGHRGECAAAEVKSAAKAELFGDDALGTAKRALHIKSVRRQDAWFWLRI